MSEAICTHCGCVMADGEGLFFQEELFCEDCLRELTVLCEHCGRRILKENNDGDSDTPLCNRCYNRYYVTCERCGRVLLQDDAYYESDDDDTPYCHRCHLQNETIHGYYYKPEPIFYGEGPRYFGIELEVDEAGESNSNAWKILEISNAKEEFIYCKHDGSLDSGFEIVTHPLSLEYQCNHMPWAEVLTALKEMGYVSHNAGTCGLHCHISRDALGDTEEEQEDTIARILYFIEKHWEELVKFSRRTQNQLERWAARYGFRDSPKELLKHAKGGYGRYTCLNLSPDETIEFRMFRGTLKKNTIIATLQLIDRICDVALYLSDCELKNMSWTTFVAGCTQPELIQYLKERRLYVNEPVIAEAEV